jgi:hypothetical protein
MSVGLLATGEQLPFLIMQMKTERTTISHMAETNHSRKVRTRVLSGTSPALVASLPSSIRKLKLAKYLLPSEFHLAQGHDSQGHLVYHLTSQ